jgi:carbon monoxide dehydrogenase subunit G
MNIEGREHVAVAINDVWRGLNDTQVYRDSMPELTSLEETEPDHMDAVLELQLPAISGRFEGSLDVLERAEPERLKLRLEGKGGPGFVVGEAELLLTENGDGTDVHYRVDVQVGGQIARLGQRMIAGVTKEMASNFFIAFEQVMQGGEKPRAANPIIGMIRLVWQTLLSMLGLSRRSRDR